jgi:endonuclease/exonuclease/phosphatase family metal-dependent hydrolase
MNCPGIFSIFIIVFSLFLYSCSNEKPTKQELPASDTLLAPSEFDTTLTFITINMAVGFDAERMLTKDMISSQIVLEEGQFLYDQLKQSKPEERMTALADSIALADPDIVALQEVLYLENRQNGDVVDFLKLLLDRLDTLGISNYTAITHTMNPLDIIVNVTSPIPDSVDIFFREGNAILYKSNVLSLKNVDSLTYFFGIRNIKFLTTTISILRGAQYAKFLTTKGTVLNVFNTHLEVESVPLLGMNQTYELRDYIRSKGIDNGAVIAMGDFNDIPTGNSVRVIKNEGFLDTYSSSVGVTCCYDLIDTTINATRRIDYIFARNIVQINNATIANYKVSDHAVVLAQLTFH